ncbi:MAG: molecular chaperone GrpE [Pirellulaceae bacterium]|jgi:molecular chaperone GrpE
MVEQDTSRDSGAEANDDGGDCNAAENRHDETPEFGLVDIVEAFTAMRHEFRGQTKESRNLVATIEAVAERLQQIDAGSTAQAADATDSQGKKSQNNEFQNNEFQNNEFQGQQFAESLAELDSQITRAVDVAAKFETKRQEKQSEVLQNTRESLEQMSSLAKWFAGQSLKRALASLDEAANAMSGQSVVQGLQLVVAQVRRVMQKQQIKRVETGGQPFDAETMNAIGSTRSSIHSAGHVAEQISPAYIWQGKVLRFAEVRIAISSD